jgi:hypothetical protein
MFGPNSKKFAGAYAKVIEPALFNLSNYNAQSPREVQQLGSLFGSLLGKGSINFNDDTGNVNINPLTGQIEMMGKNFGVGFSANKFDPSAELKFQFGKAANQRFNPIMMQQFLNEGSMQQGISPGRQAMEEQVDQYRSNNPYWYRP